MATPTSMLPIDEELQDALSNEAAYEQGLYFTRTLLGTGISLASDTADFIGDMAATSKAMSAKNIKRIEELKAQKGKALEGREGRIDAKTAAAMQQAANLSQAASTQMAQDPTKAAGAIQALGQETARIVGTAQAQAETSEQIAEATAEKQRIQELIPREQAELDRKQARKRAKFDFTKKTAQSIFKAIAAGAPQTRGSKLESQAIRADKKAARIADRQSNIGVRMAKPSNQTASDEKMQRLALKSQTLGQRSKAATDKAKAARAESNALTRATRMKQQAPVYPGYNPFPLGQSSIKTYGGSKTKTAEEIEKTRKDLERFENSPTAFQYKV